MWFDDGAAIPYVMLNTGAKMPAIAVGTGYSLSLIHI